MAITRAGDHDGPRMRFGQHGEEFERNADASLPKWGMQAFDREASARYRIVHQVNLNICPRRAAQGGCITDAWSAPTA